MIRRAGLALLVLCGACLVPLPATANADARQQELKTLRDRIRAVQREIAQGEEHREEASDELASSDKAISAARARLRQIARQRAEAEAEVRRLQAQQAQLEAQLERLRQQLGDALFRMYVEGGQAGTRRLFSGDDPNQIARDAHYLEHIARERITAIEAARAARVALTGVLAAAEAKRAELLGLEDRQRSEERSLLAERNRQRKLLQQIASQLRDQQRQVANLKQDEARIEKLLRGLERIARSTPPVRRTPPAGAPVGEGAVVSPEPAASARPQVFAARKGQLGWPVKGVVAARFGSPRGEGATTWRGLFIRTARDAEVHAVAAGTVAFSDWLRGFGNLVIIDHGNDYMTVYGNNEAIFKQAGEPVGAGEVIASAGSSGGQEESGLYFEIRHRGQPQDPSVWMTKK